MDRNEAAQDSALRNGVRCCASPRKDGVDPPPTASVCPTGGVIRPDKGAVHGKISTIAWTWRKTCFRFHGVDARGSVALSRQLRRGGVKKFFAQLRRCSVRMEACGSAHHWARVISKYGHEVKLMPPAYVKPYVKRNKNDGEGCGRGLRLGRPADNALCGRKERCAAGTLAVHGTRALLVRQRTMAANALRAALSELGIIAAQGYEGLRANGQARTAERRNPEMMRAALLVLAKHWRARCR